MILTVPAGKSAAMCSGQILLTYGIDSWTALLFWGASVWSRLAHKAILIPSPASLPNMHFCLHVNSVQYLQHVSCPFSLEKYMWSHQPYQLISGCWGACPCWGACGNSWARDQTWAIAAVQAAEVTMLGSLTPCSTRELLKSATSVSCETCSLVPLLRKGTY